jgi:hypothetical protein
MMKGCVLFGAWVAVALWLCGLWPSDWRWWLIAVVTDALFVMCAAKAPNDPKLSDRRSWRALCMAGVALLAGMEAQGMTAEPVRCSAWLGDVGAVVASCDATPIEWFLMIFNVAMLIALICRGRD